MSVNLKSLLIHTGLLCFLISVQVGVGLTGRQDAAGTVFVLYCFLFFF